MVGVLALYQMASAVLVGQHELSRDGKIAMVAGAAADTSAAKQLNSYQSVPWVWSCNFAPSQVIS
jgi:hypothetical protein